MLRKEDYEEPTCPFCKKTDAPTPIDIARVIERLDEYLSENDIEGATRHLAYWLTEALAAKDKRGEIAVRNEQIGLFRKRGMKKEAIESALLAEEAVRAAHLDDTLTAATVRLNHATARAAFGEEEMAITLYREVLRMYQAALSPSDLRIATLENNLASALTAKGSYEEARTRYLSALAVVEKEVATYPDAAVTYLNLADLVYREKGAEAGADEIGTLCLQADKLLKDRRVKKDGYYAFVADKCAGGFRFHGFFRLADEYTALSRRIYEEQRSK